MVLRTTAYTVLAVQELIEHDRELGRGGRQLAVESLVLHHGDRRWNRSDSVARSVPGLRPRTPTGWWSAYHPTLRSRGHWICRR